MKTKATTKYISFYYVLSPSKLVPTIPSNQGLYKSLWDDSDRSICLFKRTALLAKKSATLSSPPEAKKSKTSDVSTDEPINDIMPKSFEDANSSRGLEGDVSKP